MSILPFHFSTFMKLSPAHFLVPVILFAFSSCALLDSKPRNQAADTMAVVPDEFLFTRYEPLNQWLDTKVRVQIFDVPLHEVFNQPCLKGLNYRIVQESKENPIIFVDKIALTRRQLLWSLAQNNQLHMSPVFGPDGKTASIEIRSRAVRNEARARGDS